MNRGETKSLLAGILIALLLTSDFYGQSMSNNYASRDYGFTIEFPHDWNIKDGVTAATVVNAVYRDEFSRVAMITINAERLTANGARDFKNTPAEGVADVIRSNYGNLSAVLACGASTIDGKYMVWLRSHTKLPDGMDRKGITYVIPHNGYLLTVSGLADVEIYSKIEALIESTMKSIRFDYEREDMVSDVTESGESVLVSLFKAWWEVFLMVIVTGVAISIIKFGIAKAKKEN